MASFRGGGRDHDGGRIACGAGRGTRRGRGRGRAGVNVNVGVGKLVVVVEQVAGRKHGMAVDGGGEGGGGQLGAWRRRPGRVCIEEDGGAGRLAGWQAGSIGG